MNSIKKEIGISFIYLLIQQNLLDKLGLDADDIVNMKMDLNEAKYPVDKAKGKADKYNQLQIKKN